MSDDVHVGPGRYDLREEEPTRAGLARVRREIASVAEEHAEDRALLTKMIRWVIGLMGTALVAGFVPLVSTLISVGEVKEQQRAMRAEVSEVLTVTRQLEGAQVQTHEQINAAALERASQRNDLRDLQTKLWEAQRAATAAQHEKRR